MRSGSNPDVAFRSVGSVQVRTELINARVWAGIHFRTACMQGAVLGKKVAYWLASTTSSRLTEALGDAGFTAQFLGRF